MTKLYYTPTSCGAASFIAAYAAGVTLETEIVNLSTHRTSSGVDFYTINPKGNVPTLVLNDGTVLNENSAILQYIADLSPGRIAPGNGTVERFILQNVLSYVSSEVHANIGSLFNPSLTDEVKSYIQCCFAKRLAYLECTLIGDKKFLVGDTFSIADSYLYIVLTWTGYVGIEVSPYPRVQAYCARIVALDIVKAAHARMAISPAYTV